MKIRVRRVPLAIALTLALVSTASFAPAIKPVQAATWCSAWAGGAKVNSTTVSAQALTDCSGPVASMYSYLYIQHCDWGIGPSCFGWESGGFVANNSRWGPGAVWVPISGLAYRYNLASGRYRARVVTWVNGADGSFSIEDNYEGIPPLP